MKKTIAILFGGASPEYSVSLESAYAVITHIDTGKYLPVLVGITKQGHWFRYRSDAQNILSDTWCDPKHCAPAFISPCRRNAGLVEPRADKTVFTKLDAAFPVMHGCFGEDGTMQGLLELAGIPIVGCGTAASAVCMDKDISHRLAKSSGIEVPRSFVFSKGASLGEMESAAQSLGFPVFVKPVRAGSSFGISKVGSVSELSGAADDAFLYDTQILLEETVDGFEVGCAVIGDSELTIGVPDEIELSNGFFDYKEKYNLITSKIHVPARVTPEMSERIKETAARIYRALGCGGFARVDQFVTPAGRIVFNEVNTVPGFTAHSRFPSMLDAAGLDFAKVVNMLIEAAVAL
ncbi:MAG: D-alanine--D-serine ligase VanG [Clostridiales bacterium]|nr:D-alanine--D-serine ligase VanG [Clostridiales bacterium]